MDYDCPPAGTADLLWHAQDFVLSEPRKVAFLIATARAQPDCFQPQNKDKAFDLACHILMMAPPDHGTELLQMLLDLGLVDAGVRFGCTLLHRACLDEHIRCLLDRGFDVAAQDDNGWTALYSAAWHLDCQIKANPSTPPADLDARVRGIALLAQASNWYGVGCAEYDLIDAMAREWDMGVLLAINEGLVMDAATAKPPGKPVKRF